MSKDLMYRDEIEELVSDSYSALETPGGPALAFYTDDQLMGVPDEAQSWALGLGNPLTHAGLKPGETVLDLGSGSGIDVLIAAKQVGPSGRAIGIDMLPEMIERSEKNAADAGIPNAEFLLGHMDDIPLPDDSVDVIISNGSINLAARKSRVFAEARRVLRRGGRLCVADLTVDENELPTEILTHPSAWAG
jgi:ubiquinone/menaquinone biosynthesis C-methylase UbiE